MVEMSRAMDRRIISLAFFLVFCLAVGAEGRVPDKRSILARISEPEFGPEVYNVLDYGADPGGVADSRDAINEAISVCSSGGGGVVLLPPGEYRCDGSVILKSNVNLNVSEGAAVVFSDAPEDYLPAVLTIWEGTELFNYSPLVYSYHAENIAITGKGTLDGRASSGFARFRPQKSAIQDSLRQMGIDGVPVNERCFGKASILPPSMIQPFGCRNILIEGVTILDSPYWVIHPVYCNNVIVRDVTINSRNLNNDGCDPEYTSDVLIEGCTFNVGDDAIAIKAGRDNDAWRKGMKTSNILIRDCDFNSKCNGLCIGSEMSAGVENVYMENVRISRCLSGIYFKSNLDRGGFIRNVHVRNVTCDTVRTAFIRFDSDYHGARGGFYPTVFENFLIEDVTGTVSSECGFYAVGIENYEMRNIRLKNVVLESAPVPYVLKHVRNVRFDNVTINGVRMPEHPSETSAVRLKSF